MVQILFRAAVVTGLFLILLAITPGCSSILRRSGSSGRGYQGPEEFRNPTAAALEDARVKLSHELGRDLTWDRARNHTLIIREPTGRQGGDPLIPHPVGLVRGYATPHSITLPRGFHYRTLVHEAGHLILYANGIGDATGHDHHQLAPRFFRNH